jgi:hypothetical protein
LKVFLVLRRQLLKSPRLFLAKSWTAKSFFENLTTISQIGSDCSQQAGMGRKKSKNLASLLAEFLFLPCPIRAANAPVPLIFLRVLCVLGG